MFKLYLKNLFCFWHKFRHCYNYFFLQVKSSILALIISVGHRKVRIVTWTWHRTLLMTFENDNPIFFFLKKGHLASSTLINWIFFRFHAKNSVFFQNFIKKGGSEPPSPLLAPLFVTVQYATVSIWHWSKTKSY